jgi:hypothetical protein
MNRSACSLVTDCDSLVILLESIPAEGYHWVLDDDSSLLQLRP